MNFNSLIPPALGASLAFLAAWFWWRKNAAVAEAARIATAHAELVKRMGSMEAQLEVLKAQSSPINAVFQAILVKELTHLHAPELDELMTRIGPPSTLSTKEEARLAELLAQRAKDLGGQISDSERDAALMLPYVIKRARAEAEEKNAPTTARVVVVPTPEKESK